MGCYESRPALRLPAAMQPCGMCMTVLFPVDGGGKSWFTVPLFAPSSNRLVAMLTLACGQFFSAGYPRVSLRPACPPPFSALQVDFLKKAELREYELERDKRLAGDVRLRNRL